jgi:hypothetical protein
MAPACGMSILGTEKPFEECGRLGLGKGGIDGVFDPIRDHLSPSAHRLLKSRFYEEGTWQVDASPPNRGATH